MRRFGKITALLLCVTILASFMSLSAFADDIFNICSLTPPTKTVYRQGEDLDTTGLKVLVEVNNDPSDIIDVTDKVIIDELDTTSTGQKKIYVHYGYTYKGSSYETSAYFTVEVKSSQTCTVKVTAGEGGTATGGGKGFYIDDSVTLKATASDGWQFAYWLDTDTSAKFWIGWDECTITPGGDRNIEAVFESKYSELRIQGGKTLYEVGETLDTRGIELFAVPKSNPYSVVSVKPGSCEITGFDSTTTGKKTITFKYCGVTATMTVNVTDQKLPAPEPYFGNAFGSPALIHTFGVKRVSGCSSMKISLYVNGACVQSDQGSSDLLGYYMKGMMCGDGNVYKVVAEAISTTEGVLSSSTTIYLTHDIVEVNAKPETCTDSGYEAYEYCKRCGYTTRGADIPATGHDWSYSASGSTVSATCSGCALAPTLTINAPSNCVYDGQAKSASLTDNLTSVTNVTAGSIKYTGRDGTTYAESTTAPTLLGKYTASVTVEGKTASVNFEITPITVSSVAMTTDVPYAGGTPWSLNYSYTADGKDGAFDTNQDNLSWYYWDNEISGGNKWHLMNGSAVFAAGEKYAVKMQAYINYGYSLSSGITGTVNGNNSDTNFGTVRLDDGTVCLACVFEIPIIDYKITEGNNGVYKTHSGQTLSFTCDDEAHTANLLNKFISVSVDGSAVAAANYTATEGSVVLELKSGYLDSLEPGDHTLVFTMIDGTSEAGSFKVELSDFTVSFDMNGHGTAVADQTVKDGSSAAKPTAPAASGYNFGGWYTNKACTTEYDFSVPVNGDITLYAKWTAATNPKTGDENSPLLWLTMIAVSGGALLSAGVYGKKKKSR